MRKTVDHLRHGWYGNLHLFDHKEQTQQGPMYKTIDGEMLPRKRPVNCAGLVRTSVNFMNNKFISLCEDLSGTIDDLTYNDEYKPVTEGMPIDMILLDLSTEGSFVVDE